MYSVAELFCGCGGFSNGFARTKRFRVVLGNDIKKLALETFATNHAHDDEAPIVVAQDIRTVADDALIKLLKSRNVSELDCLIGGPPCQGFSQMRRTNERRGSKIVSFGGYNKLDQDSRNDLVLRFLEVVAALNPKVVVIENVPQFLSHYHDGKKGGIAQQVEAVLQELGYQVVCNVLNAANYGVPQLRLRAVIMASRIGHVPLPVATHGDPDELTIWRGKPWITVREAIADLPATPPMHDTLGGTGTEKYTKRADNPYARLMQSALSFPYNHVTRRYQNQIIQIIREMRQGETWDDASQRMQQKFEKLIAKAVAQGESTQKVRRRLEDEGAIQPVFYKRYYWSAYTRLAWDRPALTITANANFLGSGRFTHPSELRGITMREAARLQSFDDNFTFITSDDPKRRTENIGIGMDMIGEAVPPLLASAIAETVAVHLDEKAGKRP